MSLSVRAPSVDYTNTQGLCGTFDRNTNNDYHNRDGSAFGPDELHRFIEHWRSVPNSRRDKREMVLVYFFVGFFLSLLGSLQVRVYLTEPLLLRRWRSGGRSAGARRDTALLITLAEG